MPRFHPKEFKVKIVSDAHTEGIESVMIGKTYFVYDEGDASGAVYSGRRYKLLREAKTGANYYGWVISSLDVQRVGTVLNQ